MVLGSSAPWLQSLFISSLLFSRLKQVYMNREPPTAALIVIIALESK